MLNDFFNPKTIALIGASNEPGSVGLALAENLLASTVASIGRRNIYFVNPNRRKILGRKTYSNVLEIKEPVDLAIIAVPAKVTPAVVEGCGQKGVGSMIVISAGFAETGGRGEKLQTELLKALQGFRPSAFGRMRMLGPNCLGIVSPATGFNASFAPAMPKRGGIGIISQSGALIDALIDYSEEENLGFSRMVSSGNSADLEMADFIDFLRGDKETKVMAIYLEGLKKGEGGRFLKSLKQAAKAKPIIVLKAGVSPEAGRVVSSHTSALAGRAEIYRAAFEQAGVFQAEDLAEFILGARALADEPALKGRVGIVSNAGALTVLAADWCAKLGVPFSKPVDVLGDARAADYERAIFNLLKRKDINGLIIGQTIQTMTKPIENARVVAAAKQRYKEKPLVCLFVGKGLSRPGIEVLDKNQILNCREPKKAAFVMKCLLWKTKFSKVLK